MIKGETKKLTGIGDMKPSPFATQEQTEGRGKKKKLTLIKKGKGMLPVELTAGIKGGLEPIRGGGPPC